MSSASALVGVPQPPAAAGDGPARSRWLAAAERSAFERLFDGEVHFDATARGVLQPTRPAASAAAAAASVDAATAAPPAAMRPVEGAARATVQLSAPAQGAPPPTGNPALGFAALAHAPGSAAAGAPAGGRPPQPLPAAGLQWARTALVVFQGTQAVDIGLRDATLSVDDAAELRRRLAAALAALGLSLDRIKINGGLNQR